MKDVGEFLLKIISIIIIPVFMIIYALYGIRVWGWNFCNSSCINGEWTFKIPKKGEHKMPKEMTAFAMRQLSKKIIDIVDNIDKIFIYPEKKVHSELADDPNDGVIDFSIMKFRKPYKIVLSSRKSIIFL